MEELFIKDIKENEGIIFKVIGLYTDSEEDKKDLYQEILYQAWRSFQNFKKDSKFSTWLYKVALNTALNFRRKEKQKTTLPDTMEAQLETNENFELLYLIIKSFDEVNRMLITLHLDGYKNIEIAEITGMTQNHINVKLHRLKNIIIEKFKKLNH